VHALQLVEMNSLQNCRKSQAIILCTFFCRTVTGS